MVLVLETIGEGLEEYQRAAEEDRQAKEWLASIVGSLTAREKSKAEVDYDIWRGAMEIVRGHFKQAAELLGETVAATGLAGVYFRDFGQLEFEKFLQLRKGDSAKRTWYFRVDFRSGERAARYLFFFGFPTAEMSHILGHTVTLHVATETRPYYFERVEYLTTADLPDLVELAYDPVREEYVSRVRSGQIQRGRVEGVYQTFIAQAVKRKF